MTNYKLIKLAPGSYDLELDDEVVASVVRSPDHQHQAPTWYVELLDERGPRPPPFSRAVHEFSSLEEAEQWLTAQPATAEPRS